MPEFDFEELEGDEDMGDIEDYPDYDYDDETDTDDIGVVKEGDDIEWNFMRSMDDVLAGMSDEDLKEEEDDEKDVMKESKEDVKAVASEGEVDDDDLGNLDFELPDVEDGEWNFVRSMEDVMAAMDSDDLGEEDSEEDGEEIDIVLPTMSNKSEREEL